MSEELIVRHCSPTLAGMKTGNIFTCTYESAEELRGAIRAMNRRLAKKGLRILPLRIGQGTALIYVYRPSRLQKDLAVSQAETILSRHGYTPSAPEKCIVKLIGKLKDEEAFPHEIGLFLGYPPEDVEGFIENKAGASKCVGYWKVYGDEEAAKKLFAKYRKCTDVYTRCLTNGTAIERLAVAMA